MDRERQNARVVPERRLYAVPMVDVEVDVQDAKPVGPGPRDGERGIVVYAETGCSVRHGVVQAAARVERVLDVPSQHGLHRRDRAPGYGGRRLVHPGEGWRVADLGDPRLGESEGVDREPLDGLDVSVFVQPTELIVGGRFGREAGLAADLADQVDARPEPARREGVARAEVVRRRTRP